MNKHLYRLVFNRALGVIQVVAEIAKGSGGKGANADGPSVVPLRPLSFALWTMFGFVSVIPAGLAQVVADPTAPGNQKPTVLQTPNGIPLVNIQTPSAAGVSRNTYSQFDVNAQGVVLNNSRASADTRLAGWVSGNPWLATGTAKVILNEVNGPQSRLSGYLEIAGDRAQLVIANPAGITCSGCGFINASRATLTTGTPIQSNGALDGYRVEGGSIRVEGNGLDATRADYTDVITRSLILNGGIWANQLQATLGANAVSADQSQVTALAPSGGVAPTFALDASALGGMFASKIALVGTEHGVGVRNAGAIGAQAGELTVTVDGRIENSGALQAQTNTHINAAGGLSNAGTVSAVRELSIVTPMDVDNRGGTLNAQRIEVSAQSLRNRGGSIEQTGAQVLALNAGTLTNRDGGRIGMAEPATNGSTNGSGTDGDTGGGTGTGDSTGTGGTGIAGGAPGSLPVAPMADGALEIVGTLDNDGGHINAGGGVSLNTANGLDNSGGHLGLRGLTLTQGDLGNTQGELSIAGDASLHVGTLANDGGRLEVAGALDIDAQTLVNRSGALSHSGTAPATVHAGTFDNTAGTFASNADTLALKSAVFVNEEGRLEHAGTGGLALQIDTLAGARGTIVTAGAMTLDAGQVDQQGGTLGATQVAITSKNFDNRGGAITATGIGSNTITVAGTLDNGTGGTIASNGDMGITAATLGNAGGTVQQAGTGALTIDATTLNGAGGTIASNGALAIIGETTDLSGGTTVAQRLAIDTGTLVTAGGTATVTGPDALVLTARNRLDNTAGQIAGNGPLQLRTGALTNINGVISAAGPSPSQVTVAGTLDNSGGTLTTGGDATVAAQDLINQAGALQSAGSLTVTATRRLDNSALGVIASDDDLALTTPTLDNWNGTIQHAGDGTLTIDANTLNGNAGIIASNGTLALLGETTDLRNATTFAQTVTIETGTLTTAGGSLIASGAAPLAITARTRLDNSAGLIASNGAVQIDTGALTNTDGTITATGADASAVRVAGSFDNTRGTVATAGATTVQTSQMTNTAGTLYATGDLAVASTSDVINRDGGLVQSQAAVILSADGTLDNTAGTIDASGAGTVTAASITNADGHMVAGTSGQPDATLTLTTAGALDNQGGTIGNRGGDTAVQAGSIDNSAAGTMVAQRDITLSTATTNNAGGTVYAIRTLRYENAAGTLDNGAYNGIGGQFGAGDAAWLNLASISNTNGGRIQAGTVWLTTPMLDVTGGEVAANTLHARLTSLNGVGRLYGAGWLDVDFSGDFTYANGQRFDSDGQLDLNVAGTFTNQGALQTAGELNVTAANLINQGAINASNGNGTGVVRLTATGTLDNQRGASLEGDTVELTALDVTNTGDIVGDVVSIDADTLNNGQDLGTAQATRDYGEGFIGASQYLDFRVANRLSNLDAEIFSAGDLTIAGRTEGTRVGLVDNVSGRIQAEGDAYIAAETLDNRRRMIATETYTLTPEEQAALTYSSQWQRVAHVSDLMLDALNARFREIVREEYGKTDGCLVDDSVDSRCRSTGAGTPDDNPTAEIKQVDNYQTGTRLAVSGTSAASELVAGGDLVIDTGTQVTNRASRIAAGGNFYIDGQTVDPNAPDARIANIALTSTYTGERTTYAWVHDPQVPVRYYDSNWSSDRADFMASMVEAITAEGPVLASASITAGGGVTIVGGDVNNTSVGSGVGLSSFGTTDPVAGPSIAGPGGSTAGSTVAGNIGPSTATPQVVGTPERPLPNLVPTDNGMFDVNTDPNAEFMATTAPRFAGGDNTGSNYLLSLLGSGTHMHKRLGDGYYEQRLVMEQILQLTGYRSLNGNGDGAAQYRDLMDNAAAEAARLGLTLGAPLTSAQIAALDQDIVWLVEQEINGQKVLVPVVYLSKATAARLAAEGALIGGETVGIQSPTTVRNDGTLTSTLGTWLSADTLINDGAILSKGRVDIATVGDTVNRGEIDAHTVTVDAGGSVVNTVKLDGLHASGGTIQAGTGGLQITAVEDVINQGHISSEGHGIVHAGRDFVENSATATSAAAVDGVQIPAGTFITGGSAVITADRDVVIDQGMVSASEHVVMDAGRNGHFTAATVEAGGSMAITARGDITSDTVTTTEVIETDEIHGKTRTKTITSDETVHGSTFRADGDIAMKADSITLTSATVYSDNGGIALSAVNDVTLDTAHETHTVVSDSTTKKSGLLNSSTKQTHDERTDTYAVGTTLSGETVQIGAGNVVTIEGSDVVSSYGTTIAGVRGVEIVNATDESSSVHTSSKTTSGVFGNGGASLTIGSKKNSVQSESSSSTVRGSMVGSLHGDTTIIAREGAVHVQGSTVSSPEGNVTLLAQSVNIEEAHNTSSYHEVTKTKQGGLTVGASAPVVDAAIATYDSAKTTGQSKDSRVNAMAAANTAYNAYQAAGAVAGAMGTQAASVSITIGQQSTRNELTTHTSEVVGSAITGGGRVDIVAIGAGDKSDIRISGSDVYGGTGAGLYAEDAIDIVTGRSTSDQRSTNESNGWNVGVAATAGAGGWAAGVTAGVNVGGGSSDGESVTHVNAHVGSGGTTTLTSGGVTSIIGGRVTGERVEVDALELTIASLQDTSSYQSEQKDASVQVTVGFGASVSGSYSQSNVNSNYASVGEQSGILAGDGGYAVNVRGETVLTGGIVTSTQAAEDAGRNSFTTGTLIATDIENHADYEGSAFGISGSAGVNGQGEQGQHEMAMGAQDANGRATAQGKAGATASKSAGFGSDEGHQDSVTRSGINTANLVITDSAGQAATGKSVEQIKKDIATTTTTGTVAADSGSLIDTFDANAVQKELNLQVQVTQTFDRTQQGVRREINSSIDDAKQRKDDAEAALKQNPNLSNTQKAELIAIALDAQNDIERLQEAGVLVSAIAGGLSSPADSAGGILTSTLAPEVSYLIGQHFKENAAKNVVDGGNRGEESSASHLLAHALLGAVVAASGSDNALLAGITAAGAEAAAPALAQFLYGKESKDLTAGEKSTISAVVGLGGAAIGSFGDDLTNLVADSSAGQNAVDNNWGEVGHYSTMATILYLAGFSEQDAKAVALAAWSPDTDKRNAITVDNLLQSVFSADEQQKIHLLDGEADPQKVVAKQQELGAAVAAILARIKQHENNPAVKAAILSDPTIQRLLHSFGDSYAHVEADGTHYSPFSGHASDSVKGPDPDNPFSHKDAYSNYVMALYQAAAGTSDQPLVDRKEIAGLAKDVAKNQEESAQKRTLGNAIASRDGQDAAALVNSPLPDCGYLESCVFLNAANTANPAIREIYGLPKDPWAKPKPPQRDGSSDSIRNMIAPAVQGIYGVSPVGPEGSQSPKGPGN